MYHSSFWQWKLILWWWIIWHIRRKQKKCKWWRIDPWDTPPVWCTGDENSNKYKFLLQLHSTFFFISLLYYCICLYPCLYFTLSSWVPLYFLSSLFYYCFFLSTFTLHSYFTPLFLIKPYLSKQQDLLEEFCLLKDSFSPPWPCKSLKVNIRNCY